MPRPTASNSESVRFSTHDSSTADSSTDDERLRPAFWILVATVVVVTLGMAPGLHYFDVTPKLVALAGGACLVWIALAAANRLPAPEPEQRSFFRLLWGLAVAAVLSTIFSLDSVLSLAGTEGRRLGLPALLATLAIAAAVPSVAGNDPRRRRVFVAAIALTGVAAAVYGIAQYLGIDPWIDPSLYRIGGGESLLIRPPSTLGHANFFAIFLLLALFSAIGLGLSSGQEQPGGQEQTGEEKWKRWGWAVAAATIGLGLVSSGSRAGWLGGAVGVGVLLLRFSKQHSEHRAAERRALLTGLTATAVLGLAFFVSPWGQPLRNRLVLDDPGITARVLIWRDTLGLIATHPLLGSGPDTFELAFARTASSELARLAPDQYAESPHNVFLESFVGEGLPGGLLFLALMLLALRAYGRASSSSALSSKPLQTGLLAALVAGLAAAQFSGETMATRLGLLTFAALSVSVPLAPARPADRGMAGGIGVACLAVAIIFGSRMAQADRALFRARESASQGDFQAALEQGRRGRAVFPWTGVHSFAFSRMLGQALSGSDLSSEQRAELLDAAEESARAGMLHASQPQAVLVHRASIEVLRGREQQAGESLESAIEEAPSWYRPRWLLAVLLAGRGELSRAAEQAKAALELGAGVHPEIAESCRKILDMALVQGDDADAREVIHLSYADSRVEPSETHPETPNGRWAFPYTENSFITLPRSTMTFRVNVPAEAQFLATVRMPLPEADPARAVVRINGEELFSEPATPQAAIRLDLSRYAGQNVELELGAEPLPQGQRAAWVQWLAPRVVVGLTR